MFSFKSTVPILKSSSVYNFANSMPCHMLFKIATNKCRQNHYYSHKLLLSLILRDFATVMSVAQYLCNCHSEFTVWLNAAAFRHIGHFFPQFDQIFLFVSSKAQNNAVLRYRHSYCRLIIERRRMKISQLSLIRDLYSLPSSLP